LIFVTVGHELGFDRLIEAVDKYAKTHPEITFFAQVGSLNETSYIPQHIGHSEFVTPAKFESLFENADLIVAHAGMGSIITALTRQRPLLIMPRRGHLMETRNDHQVATAARFRSREGVFVADDETVFSDVLDEVLDIIGNTKLKKTSEFADTSLISAIRNFIHND